MDNKDKQVKKGKEIDVSIIEEQVADLLKNTDIPDMEKICLSDKVKKRINDAETSELESIEKELAVDINETRDTEEAELSYSKAATDKITEMDELETQEGEGPQQVKEVEAVDGKFEIHIANDKMSVSLDLVPSKGDGKPLIYEVVRAKLDAMNVVYGVNYDLIKRVIMNIEKTKEEKSGIIVAQGSSPEEGKDGSIEFHFSESDDILRSLDENGKS